MDRKETRTHRKKKSPKLLLNNDLGDFFLLQNLILANLTTFIGTSSLLVSPFICYFFNPTLKQCIPSLKP